MKKTTFRSIRQIINNDVSISENNKRLYLTGINFISEIITFVDEANQYKADIKKFKRHPAESNALKQKKIKPRSSSKAKQYPTIWHPVVGDTAFQRKKKELRDWQKALQKKTDDISRWLIESMKSGRLSVWNGPDKERKLLAEANKTYSKDRAHSTSLAGYEARRLSVEIPDYADRSRDH